MRRMTYANVMSTIACFVALSTGSAFAVTQLTGANIKDGSITSADIKNGSLKGTDLAKETVAGNNIKNGGVGGLDIAYDAIGHGQLKDDAVESDNIASGAVGTGEIADGAVGSGDVSNGSLDVADLTTDTVDTLSVSDLDGAFCPLTSGEQGNVATANTALGIVSTLCQSTQTADAYEPNDTQGTAATGAVVDSCDDPNLCSPNLRQTYEATFTTKHDEDWYTWPATDLGGNYFCLMVVNNSIPNGGFQPKVDVYKNGSLFANNVTLTSQWKDATATNSDTYTVKLKAAARYAYTVQMGAASC